MLKNILTLLFTIAASCMFALSGFGVSGPVSLDNVAPNLILIAPNGGEIWQAGTVQNIEWSATDSHFDSTPIDISYSLSGGAFALIFDDVPNDGSEQWSLPYVNSNMVRVRIIAKDHFGNSTQKQSAAYFAISGSFPQAPQGVTITIVNNTDALISWQAVTHNVDGSLVTPDGYLVMHSPDPGADPLDYVLAGESNGLSFSHPGAAASLPQRFYYVLAYIDPDGRLRSLLRANGANPGSITSKDITGINLIVPGGDQ